MTYHLLIALCVVKKTIINSCHSDTEADVQPSTSTNHHEAQHLPKTYKSAASSSIHMARNNTKPPVRKLSFEEMEKSQTVCLF